MPEKPLFAGGARVAFSLSFDDARDSQIDVALPLLDAHSIRATFYVLPAHVRHRRRDWQALADRGHEIGNHTVTHPCSANFDFSRTNALEDYSLDRIEGEIERASDRIEKLLGLRPQTFAYPCGQSFVGRGEGRMSFVPVVARLFLAGRGYAGETSNDPERCDLAHLDAFTIDGLGADQVIARIDDAAASGRWVIMAGHDVGERGFQTVLVDALEALGRRASQGDVWVAPVAEVAERLRKMTTARPR